MGGRLKIVSVDLGESPEVVKAFVHKMKVTFPVALGTEKTAETFGVAATPTNMVIAPDGKFVYLYEGFDENAILKAVHSASAAGSNHSSARRHTAAATGSSIVSAAVYHRTQSPRTSTSTVNESNVRIARATGAVTQASRPFPDVPPDHWAAQAVELLRERGIVIGYPPAS